MGCEDSYIYIWNKEKGDQLARLEGHNSIVSAVDWSPTEPYLFASVSDDQTIRLWGLEEMEQADVITDNRQIVKNDVFI